MNIPKVSIIVCAYNAERYLSRCLDSIVNQSMNDFEVVIVDDCSDDNTLVIAHSYARCDRRIRVLHNAQNRGVSYSRQRAFNASTGRYTIHVDADDYVECDLLQSLHDTAEKNAADVVICDYLEERDGEVLYKSQRPSSCKSRQILTDLFTGKLHGSCCNKLVARKLYASSGIRFPEGIDCCEDLYVNICIFKSNPTVAYLSKALYHYVRNGNSLTTTIAMQERFERDRVLYDMVIALFSDSDAEMQTVARRGIAKIVVLRAFHSHAFTSRQFARMFRHNARDVKDKRFTPFPVNIFLYMSCVGWYRVAIALNVVYEWLWRMKKRCFVHVRR